MIDYDGLNRLAYQIKTETGRAANTALRVGTLFEDIIDALREGDNSDLINSINKINTDISKIINQIKDINNDIDQTIIKRIEAAERNITNIISNINTITGDINTINSTLSNHATMIENINRQISIINNNLTTLSSQISNINSTISSITSDLTALTSRVTVNEADIADLRRQIINLNIDAIRESISNLESDLDNLERRVTTLEGDVIDLRADLNAEIERAEATYAKKADLPDMSDVFYKSKGGVVKAATTFENSLTMSEGNPITFNVDMQKATVPLMRVNSAVFSAIHPTSNRMDFGMLGTSFNFISNIPITRIGSDLTHTMWDSGNDGEGSGLDADLLDGHHWTDFALKSDIPSLPDMTNVFYKNIGGTVTAETTFTQKVTHSGNIQLNSSYLYFDTSVSEPTLMHLRWGSIDSRLLGIKQVSRVTGSISSSFPCAFIGNEKIRVTLCKQGFVEAEDSSLKEILHEGNSVYVVSSYPTDLSSYPDGAIFIKTS